MLRSEHPGLGNLVLELSRKMEGMQREIAGLREDVRTLTFLVRRSSGAPARPPAADDGEAGQNEPTLDDAD